jgi:hypothetical protein
MISNEVFEHQICTEFRPEIHSTFNPRSDGHSPARVESRVEENIFRVESSCVFNKRNQKRTMKKTQLDSTRKMLNSIRLEKSRVLLEFKMIRGSLQNYGDGSGNIRSERKTFSNKNKLFGLFHTSSYYSKHLI